MIDAALSLSLPGSAGACTCRSSRGEENRARLVDAADGRRPRSAIDRAEIENYAGRENSDREKSGEIIAGRIPTAVINLSGQVDLCTRRKIMHSNQMNCIAYSDRWT